MHTSSVLFSSLFLALLPVDAASSRQEALVKTPTYQVKLVGANDFEKSYGGKKTPKSGLRELIVDGKTICHGYRFSLVVNGQNVHSIDDPSTEYQLNDNTMHTVKSMRNPADGTLLGRIHTKAIFSEDSIAVQHTFVPANDFLLKLHGQPQITFVLPIQTMQLGNVTLWRRDGTHLTGIFPAKATEDNWGLGGVIQKMAIRKDTIVLTFTAQTPQTVIGLSYVPGLADNTLWRNPIVHIRPHLSMFRKEARRMKKDVPLSWSYVLGIRKD